MTKKRKLKKGVFIKLFILIVIFILLAMGVFFVIKKINSLKYKEYTKTLNYMDTVIDIKLYSNNEKEANNIIEEIDGIYKHYHELTDRYNSYDGIVNVYTINHTTDVTKLEISKDLYDILNL